MSSIILLWTVILAAGFGLSGFQQPPHANLENLAWMAGDWEMTRGTACIEERWTRPAKDMLVGMSRTVDGGRTTSFEFMRVESRSDGIYFVAQPGGRPPVDFKLASNSGSEIVFVNPGHADHLKRIIYRRSGPTALTARIEGEDGGKTFAADYPYHASGDSCGYSNVPLRTTSPTEK